MMDTAVGLVETYLRLNGFFTITEFQVQQPHGASGTFETATDLDILAVHLPLAASSVPRHPRRSGEVRCEIILAEDPILAIERDRPDILIGEVKEGAGRINRGLLSPEVLHAALRRVGCCPEAHIADAAAALLRNGQFHTRGDDGVVCRIRLASFAASFETSPTPAVLTVTLRHIVDFVEEYLRLYRDILRRAHFKDPLLALLTLMGKLDLEVADVARGAPHR